MYVCSYYMYIRMLTIIYVAREVCKHINTYVNICTYALYLSSTERCGTHQNATCQPMPH